MKRRLSVLVVLLLSSVLLAGCAILDDLIDSILNPVGDSSGQEDTVIVEAEIWYRLSGNLLWEDHPELAYADIERLANTLGGDGVVIESHERSLVATWTHPDIVEFRLEVELSKDGDEVTKASLVWRSETQNGGSYDLFEASGIPYDRDEINGRYFVLQNQDAIDAISAIGYKRWGSSDSFADPTYMLKPPSLANIYNNGTGYVTIQVRIVEAPTS